VTAADGAVVEASGAVAVGCIEAAAAQRVFAVRAVAARFAGQWASAQPWVPLEALCVGRWVAVPLSGRPEVLRYAGPWVVVPP
jgi:hypothetical protein